jgi:tripartite-type tricarboxylate transporter receptor subunit TctC
VRFIVTFVPGGGTDIVARMVGQKLSEAWGQQVIVDNRGGAGGIVGTEIAASAAPDGHTLLFGTSSGLVINPLLKRGLRYDAVRDFAPISLLTTNANLLVVHPGIQANSVKQLIALAKASPRALNYATAGEGSPSHLVMELFNAMTGTQIVHVPYKGAGPAVTDLLGGQVQLTFNPIPPLLPHVKSGKLRALAVSSAQRSQAVPDVPTVAESGVPGFEYVLWYSMFAPAKTPKAVIERINAEVVRILAQPDVKQRLIAIGADPRSSTPEELARFMKTDTERLRKIIQSAGLKAE